MFTGIIQKTGRIDKIECRGNKQYFIVSVENFLKDVRIGDSISCNGVCLTVIKKEKNYFTTELMPETLKLTKFSEAKIGDAINLELAVRVGDRLDGHIVSGHIDGVGTVKKMEKEGNHVSFITGIPAGLSRYIARKGSIALDGVSLTISGVGKDWLKVSLITHTLDVTNFSNLKVGDKVNIEVDLIARYLEAFIKK